MTTKEMLALTEELERRNEERMIVEAAIRSYIAIMGQSKWDSLTAAQQHDTIMLMVKDMLAML